MSKLSVFFLFLIMILFTSKAYSISVPARFTNPSRNLASCIAKINDKELQNVAKFIEYCNNYVKSVIDVNYMYYLCLYNEARISLEDKKENDPEEAGKITHQDIIDNELTQADTSGRCVKLRKFYEKYNVDKDYLYDLNQLKRIIATDLSVKIIDNDGYPTDADPGAAR